MTCVRTDLGNDVVAWSCSRGRRKEQPPCSVCKTREHALLCDFELRGSKAGNTCSAKLCTSCAVTVGKLDLCPPHAKVSTTQTTLPLT